MFSAECNIEVKKLARAFCVGLFRFTLKPQETLFVPAVNKTNMKMLIKLYGDDETKLVGKKIKLEVIKVRNPQTGEFVPSLAVMKP